MSPSFFVDSRIQALAPIVLYQCSSFEYKAKLEYVFVFTTAIEKLLRWLLLMEEKSQTLPQNLLHIPEQTFMVPNHASRCSFRVEPSFPASQSRFDWIVGVLRGLSCNIGKFPRTHRSFYRANPCYVDTKLLLRLVLFQTTTGFGSVDNPKDRQTKP